LASGWQAVGKQLAIGDLASNWPAIGKQLASDCILNIKDNPLSYINYFGKTVFRCLGKQ